MAQHGIQPANGRYTFTGIFMAYCEGRESRVSKITLCWQVY